MARIFLRILQILCCKFFGLFQAREYRGDNKIPLVAGRVLKQGMAPRSSWSDRTVKAGVWSSHWEAWEEKRASAAL